MGQAYSNLSSFFVQISLHILQCHQCTFPVEDSRHLYTFVLLYGRRMHFSDQPDEACVISSFNYTLFYFTLPLAWEYHSWHRMEAPPSSAISHVLDWTRCPFAFCQSKSKMWVHSCEIKIYQHMLNVANNRHILNTTFNITLQYLLETPQKYFNWKQ